MDGKEILMHIRAGLVYGQDATCGNKIDYKREESAVKAARAMMDKGSKSLEPYPCAFCHGWHIGREMTVEEKLAFSDE